jgi:hypothetical protein
MPGIPRSSPSQQRELLIREAVRRATDTARNARYAAGGSGVAAMPETSGTTALEVDGVVYDYHTALTEVDTTEDPAAHTI